MRWYLPQYFPRQKIWVWLCKLAHIHEVIIRSKDKPVAKCLTSLQSFIFRRWAFSANIVSFWAASAWWCSGRQPMWGHASVAIQIPAPHSHVYPAVLSSIVTPYSAFAALLYPETQFCNPHGRKYVRCPILAPSPGCHLQWRHMRGTSQYVRCSPDMPRYKSTSGYTSAQEYRDVFWRSSLERECIEQRVTWSR